MIDLAWPLGRRMQSDRGNPLWRGLHQVLRSSFPFERNPAIELLEPTEGASHQVRPVLVPIGESCAPGTFFVPKEASGSTVLLVHGTSASEVYPYYLFLRYLLAHGHQVLTFHLDGHGGNPRPLQFPGVEQCVPAALDFLEGLPEVDGDRIGMMGVSLGGACMLHAAPRSGVKAAVAVSTPTSLHMSEWDKLKEAAGLFVPEMYPVALEATPNCMLAFVTDPVRIVREDGEGCEEIDLLDERMMPFIDEGLCYLDPVGSAAQLDDTPLLVLNGAWDGQATPDAAQAIFAAASGPKDLLLVPRRNHFTLMTCRPAVEQAVAWFDRWL